MAQVVSPIGTAGSAAIKGVDFAGKTGSAQTVSNQLKAKMSSGDKSKYKDNGWFVGVTPRRNPEIVVACLFEGGEHGALAARVAAKVIKAYVEKQRTRQTDVAKANGSTTGTKQAEVAAVWHDGEAKQPDKLQAGHYTVTADGKMKPVAAAPGVAAPNTPAIPPGELESTESHQEMAKPEGDVEAVKPATPDLQPNPTSKPVPKKSAPATAAPGAPTATVLPVRQP
jgi:membrane peptidoglycan carboxypeptidase